MDGDNPEQVIDVPEGFIEEYDKARKYWERYRDILQGYWDVACQAREQVTVTRVQPDIQEPKRKKYWP